MHCSRRSHTFWTTSIGGVADEGEDVRERERDRRPAVITDIARSRVEGFGETGVSLLERVGESLRLVDVDS